MKLRKKIKYGVILGFGIMGVFTNSFAQISFTPINPNKPPENRQLFGGPPEHSRLPFDISPDQNAPAIFGMSLNQQGNFDIGFHSKMHKALNPEDKDQSSSDNEDEEQIPDVNLFAHSVLDKFKWDGIFSGNEDSINYFRFSALSTLSTSKYGKSISGETIHAITGGEYKGSLLVKSPDGCKYILQKQEPYIKDGNVDYGFTMNDIKKGCKNHPFPTEIHVDISKKNTIIQLPDAGLEN